MTHWKSGDRHVVEYQPPQSLQNFLVELSKRFDTPIRRLYNLPSCALWEDRRQVISDEQLRDAISELNSLPSTEAENRLYVSSDNESPTSSPKVQRIESSQDVKMNGNASPSQSEGMTGRSSASSRYLQQKLRDGLLVRDGGRCLVCGDITTEAAHVIGASERISLEQLVNEFGMTSKYELHNGLLLCPTCHTNYDNYTLGIDGDGNVYEKERGRWVKGKCIFDGIDEALRQRRYPSREVLEWKYSIFTEKIRPKRTKGKAKGGDKQQQTSRRTTPGASTQKREPKKKKTT